jgi:hypothetical protein
LVATPEGFEPSETTETIRDSAQAPVGEHGGLRDPREPSWTLAVTELVTALEAAIRTGAQAEALGRLEALRRALGK